MNWSFWEKGVLVGWNADTGLQKKSQLDDLNLTDMAEELE